MRVTGPTIAVVFLGCALLAATPARAQDAVDRFLGKAVSSVRLETENGRPETSPALVSIVDVKQGELLRVETLRSSVAHLYTVGRLDDVQVDVAGAADGGVDVIFKLVPRHPIDKLEFSGDTGVAPSQLGQLVRDRYGARLPVNVPLAKIEVAVETLLADEGYLTATASATTVPTHDPDRATLVIHVEAGERTRIASVEVKGDSPLPAPQVIARSGAQPGGPYRARALEARLAAVRDELRSEGYYEASATIGPVLSADRQSVDLTLTVVAGPKVRLVWAGDPRPAGSVEDYVPIRREGSADNDLLDDSDRRLQEALRRDGYRDPHVGHTQEVHDSELTITFTIARGQRFRVDHVEIVGNNNLATATLEAQLGLTRDEVFYDARIQAGGSRIVLEYQRRGFYEVTVQPEYEQLPETDASAEGRILVRLKISEGPEGRIASVRVNGATVVSEAEIRARMRSERDAPYVPAQVIADRDSVDALYRNLGFQSSVVTITPAFDNGGRAVTLTLDVTEGPQIIVGDITVIGNHQVSEKTIKETMKLTEGVPLGDADKLDSQRALINTGTFRSVSITEEPLLPGETRAHVLVTVDEAPATTIGYGGGLEAGRRTRSAVGGGVEDFFELAPRGFFEIGRHNLWGKNRSVNFFSRLSLRPRSTPDDPTRDGRGLSFSEYLVKTTYKSQHVLHSDTDITIGASSEQGVRTTFNFVRNEVTADILRRVTPRVSVTGRYALDFTRLFDVRFSPDKLLIDRAFPQLRLSTLSTGVVWDRRDNPTAPARGVFLSGDGELALRHLGSEAGYAKTFLQASAFRPVTSNRRFVAAGRVQVGLARGFERQLAVIGPDGQPTTELVEDVPLSQRFFAGGGSSVRGFQQDRLGVPEIIDADGLSIGGNGLVVLNGELRTILGKFLGHNMGVVGFVDSGNVFAKAADLSLANLRTSLGLGLRYDSPLGPLRLDFGFKLDRRLIGGSRERGWEYHLNLGEAF